LSKVKFRNFWASSRHRPIPASAIAVLAYTFARIGAVVNLKVEDYYPAGKRFLLRFKEKGGKEKELPVHHKGASEDM
jgi:hypothetical protein